MNSVGTTAQPLRVSQWFNASAPISLGALRGRVIVMHAFQMLCPGCVTHGLLQATKVHNSFPHSEVVFLGLHTVFEHPEAMGPIALKAFLHEYRIPFPVGVDLPVVDNPAPTTMQAYRLRGTPSLVVVDRDGILRLNHFGHMDDLQLGALLGTLLTEPATKSIEPIAADQLQPLLADELPITCHDARCVVSPQGATE